MVGIMMSASTGAMNSLLGKLTTLVGEEFTKLKNLRKEVKFISDELTGMKDALERLSDLDELYQQTRRWRDIVREMSYDIEDIIDDFMQNIGKSKKTSGFVSNIIERLKTLRDRHRIAGQIEEVKRLVLDTSAQRQRYKLDIPASSQVTIDPRVVALYEKVAYLVGMEGPKNDEEKQLKVVSIVGFGGLGKTTLANEVYRRLQSGFECGAFVAVSQKPDIPKLIHSLLSEAGSGVSFHGCDLNVLLNKVREHLQHKSKALLKIILSIFKIGLPSTSTIKSAEENFCTIVEDPQAITRLDYQIRRLSIRLDGASDSQTMLPSNTSMSHVRSVMFFGRSHNTPSLSEFKFLRVLFIDLDRATVDLAELCEFYQLRHFWINYTCLYKLPTQIRVLKHLETLHLANCYGTLPTDIVHLPGLMHLNVETRLPDGIGNMKSLRYLCRFDLAENTLDNISGLGELTNLRYLTIEDALYSDDLGRRMDALCSSLGRLFCIEHLVVDLTACIDGLMPFSSPPSPYRLESLFLLPDCWFSRIPCWMGQLRNLRELGCQVGELLNCGVGILAELPVLTDLDLKNRKSTNETIVIYGKAFPALKCFNLQISSASYLTFEDGAMPKLQRLKIMFNASGWQQNGVAPAGIEHLLALKEFSAEIRCPGVQESDKTSIESALRSATNMHPVLPHVGIYLSDYNLLFFHD